MQTTENTNTPAPTRALIFRAPDGEWTVGEPNGYLEPEGTLTACIAHCQHYGIPYKIQHDPSFSAWVEAGVPKKLSPWAEAAAHVSALLPDAMEWAESPETDPESFLASLLA